MELTKNNIRYLDSKQILKIIIPYFDTLFQKIDYLEISKDEFVKILLNEISKSKQNYSDDISYLDYLKIRVNKAIIIYGRKKFQKTIKQQKKLLIILLIKYLKKILSLKIQGNF